MMVIMIVFIHVGAASVVGAYARIRKQFKGNINVLYATAVLYCHYRLIILLYI